MRSFDYFGLDRRLLQIASPRFDEATRVVAGASDRRAAWEALVAAGLLPASWAASDRRTFTSAHGPRRREEPYPRALDAARIAGAAQLMVAVEELADRIAVALDPWGQPRPERIVWRLLPPGRLKQRWIRSIHAACEPMHLADLCATNSLSDTAAWSDAASLSSQRGRDAAQRVFAHDVAMHAAWRRAVDVGAEVPPGPFGQVLVPGEGYRPLRAPEALVGRSLATLADPMSPLMAIWEAGCVLTGLTQRSICLSLPTPAGGEERGIEEGAGSPRARGGEGRTS